MRQVDGDNEDFNQEWTDSDTFILSTRQFTTSISYVQEHGDYQKLQHEPLPLKRRTSSEQTYALKYKLKAQNKTFCVTQF